MTYSLKERHHSSFLTRYDSTFFTSTSSFLFFQLHGNVIFAIELTLQSLSDQEIIAAVAHLFRVQTKFGQWWVEDWRGRKRCAFMFLSIQSSWLNYEDTSTCSANSSLMISTRDNIGSSISSSVRFFFPHAVFPLQRAVLIICWCWRFCYSFDLLVFGYYPWKIKPREKTLTTTNKSSQVCKKFG